MCLRYTAPSKRQFENQKQAAPQVASSFERNRNKIQFAALKNLNVVDKDNLQETAPNAFEKHVHANTHTHTHSHSHIDKKVFICVCVPTP